MDMIHTYWWQKLHEHFPHKCTNCWWWDQPQMIYRRPDEPDTNGSAKVPFHPNVAQYPTLVQHGNSWQPSSQSWVGPWHNARVDIEKESVVSWLGLGGDKEGERERAKGRPVREVTGQFVSAWSTSPGAHNQILIGWSPRVKNHGYYIMAHPSETYCSLNRECHSGDTRGAEQHLLFERAARWTSLCTVWIGKKFNVSEAHTWILECLVLYCACICYDNSSNAVRC